MLRVWCEFLSVREARRPETLDLLQAGPLHPIWAVRPGDDLEALAGLVQSFRGRGLEVGIWPLLDQQDGYWPSVRNAGLFAEHVGRLVERLEARGAAPDWVAFDLEPPFRPGDGVGSTILRALGRAVTGGVGDGAFDQALETYRRLLGELASRDIATLGIATPPPVFDLEGDRTLWQRLLETPWSNLPWDRAGFMAYGSMLAGYSAGLLSVADARAVYYDFCRRMHSYFGRRSHVSVGVTGTGVYGDEPVYTSADELALDVSAARAAGIDDIAVFCLEGLLQKEYPRAWVDALADAPPRVPPPTVGAEGLLLAARMATGLLSTAGGVAIRKDRVGS